MIINVTTKQYFRTLGILHLAMAAGQAVFASITLLLKATGKYIATSFDPEVYRILLYLAPALVVAGLLAGSLLFRRKANALKNLPPGAAKYKGYQSANLLRYAVMEAPSLACIVLFLLTGNYIFLIFVAGVITVFIALRPSKAAMVRQLQIPYEEQLLLEDPEAVLYTEEASLSS